MVYFFEEVKMSKIVKGVLVVAGLLAIWLLFSGKIVQINIIIPNGENMKISKYSPVGDATNHITHYPPVKSIGPEKNIDFQFDHGMAYSTTELQEIANEPRGNA